MRLKKSMLVLAALLSALSFQARAAQKHTMCVFDIIGTTGDTFNMMKDYKTAALAQGVDLNLKVYTDERVAAEDYKAGRCDEVAVTGIRGRQFNKYVGSLDSIGAIPDYKTMHLVIQVLSSGNPSIDKHLTSGTTTVAGVVPMGAAYLFVKDKKINNVNALSGHTIAVMDYDPAEGKMAAKVGMSPVPSDITNFAGRFNNGSVDICFAPIMAYSALELYKGMEPNGGIVDYVLGQLTLQVMLRHSDFPASFPEWSRKWFLGQFPRAMNIINRAQEGVDKKWWIHVSASDSAKYDEMLRESRISMTKDGIYDPAMMTLLRKIRCKLDPSRAECVNPQE